MKVLLRHRHYGVHDFIKEVEIPGRFDFYVKEYDVGTEVKYRVDEDKLLQFLPTDFLPQKPAMVLLTIGTEHFGTGLSNLTKFRPWGKYFDAYSIELIKTEKGD